MTTQTAGPAGNAGPAILQSTTHQEHPMRSTRPTTTQTECDCEDCPSYAITGHMRRTADQADRHHQQAAADGWSDVEARDYCPGCPPAMPVADHDHATEEPAP